MMRIFITGDIHGENDCITKLNSQNWPESRELNKKDILIITGDFGLIWSKNFSKSEEYWLKWLQNKKCTITFIDGNHENHNKLDELPAVEFYGGKAGFVREGIYHLKRGEIYKFNNLKFFTFGGALSTDRYNRIEGFSYWPRELPSEEEKQYGLNQLKNNNNEVDYIITHAPPLFFLEQYELYHHFDKLILSERKKDPVSIFLNDLCQKIKFKKLFCGHMHDDIEIDNVKMLYKDIIEI